MEFDRDVVLTDFFDVLAQSDLSALDGKALFLERFGYVESSHRSVKNPVLADTAAESQFEPREFSGLSLRRNALMLFAFGEQPALLFDHSFVAGARGNRKPLRQQIISTIARANADNLSALSQIVDVFAK